MFTCTLSKIQVVYFKDIMSEYKSNVNSASKEWGKRGQEIRQCLLNRILTMMMHAPFGKKNNKSKSNKDKFSNSITFEAAKKAYFNISDLGEVTWAFVDEDKLAIGAAPALPVNARRHPSGDPKR